MIWESWSAFWDMGSRASFVWGSYAVTALAITLELLALRLTRKRALRIVDSIRESRSQ